MKRNAGTGHISIKYNVPTVLPAIAIRNKPIENIEIANIENDIEVFFRHNKALSKFNQSRETKKTNEMLTRINIDLLKKMLRTYRWISVVQVMQKTGDAKVAIDKIQSIKRSLDELIANGWLYSSDANTLKEDLVKKVFLESRHGQQQNLPILRGMVHHRPPDIALRSLLYWLSACLLNKTQRPRYNLIAEFLDEQNIIVGRSEINTGGCIGRNVNDSIRNLQLLREQYDRLRDIALKIYFLYKFKNRSINKALEQYYGYRLILPFDCFIQ